MTVSDLIAELETCNPNAEVRLAIQPSWPFEHRLGEIVDTGNYDRRADFEIYREDDGWYVDETDEGTLAGPFATDAEAIAEVDSMLAKEAAANDDEPVVYIAEAGQIDYLRGAARKALGW